MDCTFKTPEGMFNYRVGAIIVNDGKILLVRNEGSLYYYSVGGRVKMNESLEHAVLRECFEETGVHFEIDRLGFIHENFFEEQITKVRYHEFCLFYYMSPGTKYNLICNSVMDGSTLEYLEWIPIEKLTDINVYPEFFKTRLIHPSKKIEHIVTYE